MERLPAIYTIEICIHIRNIWGIRKNPFAQSYKAFPNKKFLLSFQLKKINQDVKKYS
jgi:hypothetical protein